MVGIYKYKNTPFLPRHELDGLKSCHAFLEPTNCILYQTEETEPEIFCLDYSICLLTLFSLCRLVPPAGPLLVYLTAALSVLLSSAALYRTRSPRGQEITMVDNDWLRYYSALWGNI